MIKALLLIFRPAQTWSGIDAANRSIAYVLCVHLLPLILITSAVEGYGLTRINQPSGEKLVTGKTFTTGQAVAIEVLQSVLLIGLVFLAAATVKNYATTFHRRTTYRPALVAVAYGMSPLLMLRLMDYFCFQLQKSPLSWVPWIVGAVLTVGVLYQGLPCLLKPDPPHAFGLYVMSSLTIVVIFGLWRFITWQFFLGRFPGLDRMIAQMCGVDAAVGTPP